LLQKAVEDSAFSLPVNQLSAPVKSDLGYHIIQTLERVKDRPIDPETRFKLSKEAFERWVESLYKTARIQKFPNGRS
jgi:parvulin-like peptidyl-prolyl isomerase